MAEFRVWHFDAVRIQLSLGHQYDKLYPGVMASVSDDDTSSVNFIYGMDVGHLSHWLGHQYFKLILAMEQHLIITIHGRFCLFASHPIRNAGQPAYASTGAGGPMR